MKHIVYKITFTSRKDRKDPPYYYIGSKTNCKIINNIIYYGKNKEYWGSSKFKNYRDICENETKIAEIIYETDDKKDLLILEKKAVINNNAKKSELFFNLEIPSINNFTRSGYGTYKHHIAEDKKIRLPVDDELVKNGIYVGATKNYKHTDKARALISKGVSGKNNPFYGKKHTDEVKALISLKNSIQSPERRKKSSETARKTFTGKKKSLEQRSKMSKSAKNKIMLKSLITGECIRISKENAENYDKREWVNTYAYKSIKGELKEKECVKCGFKSTNAAMISRWHNDNCKRGI